MENSVTKSVKVFQKFQYIKDLQYMHSRFASSIRKFHPCVAFTYNRRELIYAHEFVLTSDRTYMKLSFKQIVINHKRKRRYQCILFHVKFNLNAGDHKKDRTPIQTFVMLELETERKSCQSNPSIDDLHATKRAIKSCQPKWQQCIDRQHQNQHSHEAIFVDCTTRQLALFLHVMHKIRRTRIPKIMSQALRSIYSPLL